MTDRPTVSYPPDLTGLYGAFHMDTGGWVKNGGPGELRVVSGTQASVRKWLDQQPRSLRDRCDVVPLDAKYVAVVSLSTPTRGTD